MTDRELLMYAAKAAELEAYTEAIVARVIKERSK